MAALDDALGQYNQSNFDVGGTAALIRQLAGQSGAKLTEDELAASVSKFGDAHRRSFNSGYTEASNYSQIAQQAVADALDAKGIDSGKFRGATANFVNEGAAAANSRWQSTQKDDGGLFGGGFAGILGGVLGAVFAPATFGISAALGAALGGGAATLLTTGSITKALTAGGLAYLGGQVMSGFGAGAEAVPGGDIDIGMREVIQSGSSSAPAGGIVSDTMAASGISTDPAKFLQTASVSPNLSGTMTDVSPGLVDAASTGATAAPVSDPGTVSNDWLRAGAGMDGGGFAPGAGGPPPTSGSGIIDSIMKFGKENQMLSSGIMQVGGSMIKGMFDSNTANEVMDKRIAADRELLTQKTTEAQRLEEWKRRFTQGGSYFDAQVNMKPKSNVLRRPDGSVVYAQPGIITGAMANG